MSEDLEKEYLEDLDHYDDGMGIHSTSYAKCKERLIRLAKIDQANPSEALECFEYIKAIMPEWARKKDKEHPDVLEPIKQALIKSQEQEKETRKGKEKMNSAVAIVLICSFMVVAVMEIIFNRRK